LKDIWVAEGVISGFRRRTRIMFSIPASSCSGDRTEKRAREISREALDDYFGEDGKEELEVFRSKRPAGEQAARRKYLAGRTEADGSVLIRSSDL